MKTLVLIISLLLIAGCGSGTQTQQVEIPANADIRAGLVFNEVSGSKRAEVSFFFSAPVAPGVKDSPPLQTITVEEAKLNGQTLTASTNESGSVIYTSDTARSAVSNTISARINGKLYEGRTIAGSAIPNEQMVITLSPK